MVSRLVDLSHASEASQKTKNMRSVLTNPPEKYGNPVGRIVGTSGKRLIIRPTNN